MDIRGRRTDGALAIAAFDALLLGQIIEKAPFGVAIHDASPEHVCLTHNQPFLDLVREELRTAGGVAGLPLRGLVDDASFQQLSELIRSVESTRLPQTVNEFPGSAPAEPRPRHYRWSAIPIVEGDKVVRLVVTALEVSDLVRAREMAEAERSRMAFLAEAGAILSSSLQYKETLEAAAHFAVPAFADGCTIDVKNTEGVLQRLAIADVVPERELELAALANAYPAQWETEHPVGEVIRTGEPVVRAYLPPSVREEIDGGAPNFAIARTAGVTSYIVLPLIARGVVLGAIAFLMSVSGRHFTDGDLPLAEELARRVASAIDHARLHTAAQQATARLQSLAGELNAILTGVADGVTAQDAAGRYLYANDAAARLLGYASGQQVAGVTIQDIRDRIEVLDEQRDEVIPSDERPASEARRKRAETNRTFRIRSKVTGEDHWVVQKVRPIFDREGQMQMLITLTEDVTEIKAAERQKDEFLAAAAHDLKSPLTVIKGVTQLLHRRLEQTGVEPLTLREFAAIGVATERMAALVDEFLDISRLDMGRTLELRPKWCDLIAIVRETLTEQAPAAERHHLVVETDAERIEGRWDAGRLSRVIANLAGNAVKFSPNGGDVIVRIVDNPTQGSVTVTVEDSGIGIPEKDLPRIFDRFRRASNAIGRIAGTGVGLGYARTIVELHGGTMDISSQEGAGTTVRLTLPTSPP